MKVETAKEWLTQSIANLSDTSSTPQLDAQIILRNVCMIDHDSIWFPEQIQLDKQQINRLGSLLRRRISGEPIAYLVGQKEFWSLSLKVTKDTLIPRPETELLVECAIEKIGIEDSVNILDLGTGSGAIALALALERPLAQITATDLCQKALKVARQNAKAHDLKNVIFRLGNWLSAVPQQLYALIACNPPYIALDDPALDKLQTKFEPQLALISENNGMSALQHVISAAPQFLMPKGWLMLEHGYQQKLAVKHLLYAARFESIVHYKDMSGHPRVTAARMPH